MPLHWSGPSGATSPELRLRHLVRALENAHRHIAMFDAPLGQQFAEASANLDVHDPGRRLDVGVAAEQVQDPNRILGFGAREPA